MQNRRNIITGAGGVALVACLPAAAQVTDRPNPMPPELRKALERDPNAPVLGNPDGDITLTEFFDYNCPYCRKMVGVIPRLIKSDPGLRIVFREWPIFGEGSEFAARASLASLRQGRYWQLHETMMRMKGKAAEATVMRSVRKVGLDEAQLRKDMQSDSVSDHISKSIRLAEHMGIVGTPMFIAGDEGIFGEWPLRTLQELIGRARTTLG